MVTHPIESETFLSHKERRRSQRVHFVRSVKVTSHTEHGAYITEDAETEDVSAHGGLLRMKHGFPVRRIVGLTHSRATNVTLARVMRCGPTTREGWIPVALELAVPNETFWGVAFWTGV